MKAIIEVEHIDQQENTHLLEVRTGFSDMAVRFAPEAVSFPDLPAALKALRKDGQGLTLGQEVQLSKALGLPRVEAP